MIRSYLVSISCAVILLLPLNINAKSDYQIPDSVRSRISAIPLSEIASTAAIDFQQTMDILTKDIQIPVLLNIRIEIDTITAETNNLKILSDQLLEENLSFDYYKSLILRWSRITSEIEVSEKALKVYSALLENLRLEFQEKIYKWGITGDIAKAEGLTKDISQRVEFVIHYLDSASFIIKDSLNASIELQNLTSDLKILSEEYLQNLNELQKVQLGSLLLKHNAPIWAIHEDSDSTAESFNGAVLITLGIEDSRVFLKDQRVIIIWLIISFILLLIFFRWMRRVYTSLDGKDRIENEAMNYIVTKPVVLAFMFTVLLSLWWLPPRPLFFAQIFSVVFITPFLFIFKGLVMKSLRWCLYYYAILIIFDMSKSFYQFGPVADRVIILLESVIAGAYLFWFIMNRKKMVLNSHSDSLLFRFLSFMGPVYFVMILIAIFSNIFGFNHLAEVINSGILLSLVMAILLGTSFLCLVTTIYSFIQTGVANKSLLIKQRKDKIYHWLKKNIRLVVIIIWLFFSLRGLYLWGPIKIAWLSFWNAGYQFDEVSISAGSVITFALIVYLSWLVSYMIKLLLEIEVFGRLNLPRGVPMAISSLTQYFLIVIGFMIAMSFLGINLKNLSILVGALGVGIGFGLQHTVNNFISGLILAFERPVTAGDIVNVAGHNGEVVKIGIRASTIRQWDGSHVIVPNADLISGKVINWTLTKYERRIILTIHTNINADADKVLKLMKEAAASAEYVLSNPEPKSYFHGIKDKYMEFALFYWIGGNILDVKSIVNLAVQKLLVKEGIDFIMPVPVVIKDETDSVVAKTGIGTKSK